MTEQEIIEGCKEGNAKAQTALYNMHHSYLRNVIKRHTSLESYVEDLLQVTFMKAYKNIAQFTEKNGSKIQSWLHIIAVNVVRDFHRVDKSRLIEDIDGVSSEVINLSISSSDTFECEAIWDRVSQLKKKHQAILKLRMEGYKFHEIGQLIGVNRGTIHNMYSTIIKQLQKQLKDEYRPIKKDYKENQLVLGNG